MLIYRAFYSLMVRWFKKDRRHNLRRAIEMSYVWGLPNQFSNNTEISVRPLVGNSPKILIVGTIIPIPYWVTDW